jgi:hypothetical protein
MLATSAAITVGWSDSPDRVRGDVNGDGRADTVTLTRHASSLALRVDTGSATITKTIRGFSGQIPKGIGDPRVVALRPLNPRRGFEIEVEVWHGASTVQLIFYTVADSRLVAMTGGHRSPGDPAFLWNIGGTIGTGSSRADCIRRSRVGVLEQWRHRGVWHYRTTLYEVRATRFVRASVDELASERMVAKLPRDWPKVRGLDFASCGGLVAPQ